MIGHGILALKCALVPWQSSHRCWPLHRCRLCYLRPLIIFPKNAVIVDLSNIPLELEIFGETLTMPAGNQTISYVIRHSPTLPNRDDKLHDTFPDHNNPEQHDNALLPEFLKPRLQHENTWTPILIGTTAIVAPSVVFLHSKKP